MSIKIKPSRRGSFTSYCGGEVTQDCINKAKNSPNKSIRKKAVFAENARKWNKKKFGGIFKAEEGLDTEKLKSITNGASSLMGLVGTFMKNKQANTYINSMREAQKKQNDALYQQQLNQNFRNAYDSYQAPEGENMSNIVRTKRAYESALLNTVKPTNSNPELDMYEQQLNQQKWDDIQNYSNSLLDSWKNLSGNINWNKKKKKDTFSVDNETKQLIANSNPNKWKDDLAGTYNKGETA